MKIDERFELGLEKEDSISGVSNYNSYIDTRSITVSNATVESESEVNSSNDECNSQEINENLQTYVTRKKVLFTIGKYKIKNSFLLNSTFPPCELFSNDLDSLKNTSWITGAVIDAFVKVNEMNWPTCVCMSTRITNLIIREDKKGAIESLNVFKNIVNYKGKIMKPYSYKKHWYLLVVDQLKKELIHFDPFTVENKTMEKRAHIIFKKYLKDSNTV